MHFRLPIFVWSNMHFPTSTCLVYIPAEVGRVYAGMLNRQDRFSE